MPKCEVCGSESDDVEKVGVPARGVFPGPGGSPTEYVEVCGECRDQDDPEDVYRRSTEA